MKLFLASEAKNPISFAKLEVLINGFENKTVAYIPTAANGQGYHSWQDGGTWKLLQNLPAKIKVIELEDYWQQDVDITQDLKDIDVIWFGGGMTGYLMYWIIRTKLDVVLPQLLTRGVIYVGSSAGSMVACPSLKVCDWYIGETERGSQYLPALRLVDFDVYPHYHDEFFEEIKKYHQDDTKLYLLKDGEAIWVEDGKATVFGEERIIQKKPL